MVRMARIFFTGARTNPDVFPMQLDLFLHSDHTVAGAETSGYWGRPGKGDFFPFLLHKTGELDFGAAWAGEDRLLDTNLMKKKIVEGEYVTVFEQQADLCFKVETITYISNIEATLSGKDAQRCSPSGIDQ